MNEVKLMYLDNSFAHLWVYYMYTLFINEMSETWVSH